MSFRLPPRLAEESQMLLPAWQEILRKWQVEPSHGRDQDDLYTVFPFLFHEAFPELAPEDIRRVSLAGMLFSDVIFLADEVVDAQKAAAHGPLFYMLALQFETHALLHGMFPADSPFFARFRANLLDHMAACTEERRFASGALPWGEYTQERAISIAMRKSGVARTALDALGVASGRMDVAEVLIQSLCWFYIARQIYDDVQDWKADLQSGTPSLLLSKLFSQGLPAAPDAALLAETAKRLYYEGHLSGVLETALACLTKAEGFIEDLPTDLPWRHVLADVRAKCTSLLADTEAIIAKNLAHIASHTVLRVPRPEPLNSAEALAWRGLDDLTREWNLGFGEIRHQMYLAKGIGFTTDSEYHSGDVFQRALVLEAMAHLRGVLDTPELDTLLGKEIDYLLSQRLTHAPGGWSYFPSLPELAPDADDLGQVMQAFLLCDRHDLVEAHAEEPLRVLLNDLMRPEGAFETWIVPREGRTPMQERQARFNTTKWGLGPDTEVVANLLFALCLYDAPRFSGVLARGADWLATNQAEDGSWASRWYVGPFYGTYTVLRLFEPMGVQGVAAAAARRFLLTRQRADGGWALQGESDPLSTALALLALLCLQHLDGEELSTIARGFDFLTRVAQEHPVWPVTPFICPRGTETYHSYSITSLFVLKAALAWRSDPRRAVSATEIATPAAERC